jgi:hypothetical protein
LTHWAVQGMPPQTLVFISLFCFSQIKIKNCVSWKPLLRVNSTQK